MEYDPADTEGWVTVLEDQEEDSSWSNVFGVQVSTGYYIGVQSLHIIMSYKREESAWDPSKLMED